MTAWVGSVLVLSAAAAAVATSNTANSERSELLPKECGTVMVNREDHKANRRGSHSSFDANIANPGELPWQARIEVPSNGSYAVICGGILITELHVITSAHCVENEALSDLRVSLGSWEDGKSQEYGVSTYYLHSMYGDPHSSSHDLALLRLKITGRSAVKFDDHTQPACLPTDGADQLYPGTKCRVAGWGAIKVGAVTKEPEKALHWTSQISSPDSICELRTMHGKNFLTGRQICAFGVVHFCQANSGGPLICRDPDTRRHVVRGILATSGVNCGELPTLYIKVSAYVKWLLERIQLDSDTLKQIRGQDTLTGPSVGTADPATPSEMVVYRWLNGAWNPLCWCEAVSGKWKVTGSYCTLLDNAITIFTSGSNANNQNESITQLGFDRVWVQYRYNSDYNTANFFMNPKIWSGYLPENHAVGYVIPLNPRQGNIDQDLIPVYPSKTGTYA